jgi:hypothetical protein
VSKKLRNWEHGSTRLDEERADAPEVAPPPRARKDRRRWCRGKAGIPHQAEMRFSKRALYGQARWDQVRMCGWKERRKWRVVDGELKWLPNGVWEYSCWHELACTECGKILNHYPRGSECPDWKPRES